MWPDQFWVQEQQQPMFHQLSTHLCNSPSNKYLDTLSRYGLALYSIVFWGFRPTLRFGPRPWFGPPSAGLWGTAPRLGLGTGPRPGRGLRLAPLGGSGLGSGFRPGLGSGLWPGIGAGSGAAGTMTAPGSGPASASGAATSTATRAGGAAKARENNSN